MKKLTDLLRLPQLIKILESTRELLSEVNSKRLKEEHRFKEMQARMAITDNIIGTLGAAIMAADTDAPAGDLEKLIDKLRVELQVLEKYDKNILLKAIEEA